MYSQRPLRTVMVKPLSPGTSKCVPAAPLTGLPATLSPAGRGLLLPRGPSVPSPLWGLLRNFV